jgi:tetratricopeptide (TPR) repeat protein
MASLIHGFEYDIFISYRQKDNKHDGWVTEFVDNLKGELESTFKEEISVYFDINPHDGLLETHDVDASLKEKLKCLIFIPIISRTYCDPKSFAWEHEFKAFVEQASKDKFGLKVKLPNGNIASRVLPVRIHDLDMEDIKQCELFLGGVIRGVEFIYKEPGFNRPLKPDDDDKINLNKTKYRNQLTKVALAIKEIFSGLKTEPVEPDKEKIRHREPLKEVRKEGKERLQEKPVKAARSKLMSGIAIIVILIIAAVLTYPKIFKKNTLDKLRSSGERIVVAVMPFKNLTNDTLAWNVYQEIIQSSLTSYLSNYPEDLQVRQTESINNLLNRKARINYASITPSFEREISQTLDADVFIQGKIIKSGNVIRLLAQLVDTKTEEIIKSFQKEGPSSEKNFLPKIDSLSRIVKDFLIISKMEKEKGKEQTDDIYFQASTNSPEAYKYFTYGMKATDYTKSIEWFKKAISIDSTFVLPYTWITWMYMSMGRSNDIISALDSAKKWCLKVYDKKDKVPLMQQLMIKSEYAFLFESQVEQNRYLMQILDIDDQQPATYYMLANNYSQMSEGDKAIPLYKKGIEVYEKWGVKPSWLDSFYSGLFQSYIRTGRYGEGKKLLQNWQKDYPNSNLSYQQAIISFREGDTIRGNRFVEERLTYLEKNSASEENVLSSLASIYSRGGMPSKAKDCCRKLLSLQSVKVSTLNGTAWVMVEDNKTVIDALKLAERALALSPDDHTALHRKGWALFKMGRYKEAVEYMQKSWDLRMKTTVYNHELYLHLEAAKKAVAGQKTN